MPTCHPVVLAAAAASIAAAPLAAQQPASSAAPVSRLVTRWASRVPAAHPLPEYPRPQMARPRWQSLNGRWSYAITDSGAPRPGHWDGTIVVPFAVESQLGGVRRPVTETQALWYRRTFTAPALPVRGRLLLHFGAVDWEATVFVNGHRVGAHRGGYDPFTLDITDALRPRGAQELVVRVWDPTDAGEQPRGKQVRKPRSIWYTAVTGIWQPVWLEPVPAAHIAALDIVPDVDSSAVHLRVHADGAPDDARVVAELVAGGRRVASATGTAGVTITLRVPHPRLWSPDDPYLYGLRIRLAGGDAVSSYVGMRKIAVARAPDGAMRLFLNGRPLFEYGLLDQGWWPDGLYTAPTDDALRHDLVVAKRLGFNMVRKHVKVEPARWYHDADSLGMLVWQDMPSGENRTPAARAEFETELGRIIDALRNHPSIVMWVPFNEGWGQYDTPRIVDLVRRHDTTRLVDDASGWTDRGVGSVLDLHDYPGPGIPGPDSLRARVLGEFGGLGLPLDGHTWIAKGNWGYVRYATPAQLGAAYDDLVRQLPALIGDGLAAAVYTQMSDVEVEVNGIQTYDRAVVKLPADAPALHAALYAPPRRMAYVTREWYGRTKDGRDVERYTLKNRHGVEMKAITYGGIITELRTPDRDGHPGDIVLGFDSLPPYETVSPYFGAIVGRYANRIAKGTFTLDGTTYHLPINNPPNSLHGGTVGFDKVVWRAEPVHSDSGVGVLFTHTSPDGDQGYPGNLTVKVRYLLTDADQLIVDYEATTDRATPINLSQHTYWNLAGQGSGTILDELLQIDASQYTPVDSTLIPTGEIVPVAGTPFDFRTPTAIGARIDAPDPQLKIAGGYDHNWVLDGTGPGLHAAVHLVDPSSGRTLDIATDQPGIQVYTGNFLDGTLVGEDGKRYAHRGAIALETQHFPDSPNHPNFPSTILRPGEVFRSRTVFTFGVRR